MPRKKQPTKTATETPANNAANAVTEDTATPAIDPKFEGLCWCGRPHSAGIHHDGCDDCHPFERSDDPPATPIDFDGRKAVAGISRTDLINDIRGETQFDFFTYGAGTLPEIGNNNDIGRLADVAFASGYFGGRTPAQLAIAILAGRTLEMEPIQSLFDLEISDAGEIRWKGDPSYQRTFEAMQGVAGDPDFAAYPGGRQGGKTAAADLTSIGKVFNGRFGPRDDESDETAANAVSGRSDGPDGKWPLPHPEGESTQAGPESGELAAVLTPGIDGPAEPAGDPAQNADPEPEPERPIEPAAGAIDNAADGVPDLNAAKGVIDEDADPKDLRKEFESRLRELKFSDEKINAKLTTFDGESATKQRQLTQQCRALYQSKLAELKAKIFAALAEDGKTEESQRAGFYAFCEVPLSSDDWTFKQADRVWFTLGDIKPAGESSAA